MADRALAFLDGVDERPFFLFLHLYDPHCGEEWYDLGSDPRETRSTPPPEAAAARIRTSRRERWQSARRQGEGGAPVDLSPEQIEQLRALGYIR